MDPAREIAVAAQRVVAVVAVPLLVGPAALAALAPYSVVAVVVITGEVVVVVKEVELDASSCSLVAIVHSNRPTYRRFRRSKWTTTSLACFRVRILRSGASMVSLTCYQIQTYSLQCTSSKRLFLAHRSKAH